MIVDTETEEDKVVENEAAAERKMAAGTLTSFWDAAAFEHRGVEYID